MRTWKELGEVFRSMIPIMQYTFLDVSWGSAGEHWNVGGMLSSEVRSRFISFSMFAGDKLLNLPFDQDYLEVLKRDQPEIRWYRVLKDFSGSFDLHLPAMQSDHDGKSLGYIYYGRINSLPEVSSNYCLQCELLDSSHPQKGISEELLQVGLNAAAEHWRKAQQNRQANPPDFVAAANESIKALEGVAKEIALLPKGTLGDCINELRSKGKLNSGIAKCLDGLWTYSNSTHGIRHGAGQEVLFRSSEIEFMIDSCASAIKLLLRINAA
jgi:hypothetical protein